MLALVVLLPLAVAFAFVGFRDPLKYLLPAYVLTVPFGSRLSVGLPAPLDSVSTPLLLLLIFALGAQLLMGRVKTVPLSMAVPTWLLFLGWAAVSAQWSLSAQMTTQGVMNLTILVLLFVELSVMRIDLRSLRYTEAAAVLSGALAGCYGLAQLFLLGGLPVDEGGTTARFGADILGANNTAAALLLPLAIALVRATTASRKNIRVLHSVAAALVMIAIVLSGSRGGLTACLALFIVIWITTPSGRRRLASYGVIALLLMVAVLTIHPGGVGSRQVEHNTSSGRTDIWRIAIKACSSYCVGGSGWATFPQVYKATQPQVPDSRVLVRGTSYEAHDIWLAAIIETGVAGLCLLALGLFLTFRIAMKLPLPLRGPPSAALVGTLVASFFLSNIEYKFFWLVLTYVMMCRSVSLGTGLEKARRLDHDAHPSLGAVESAQSAWK